MIRPRTLSARWTKRREEGISRLNGERGDVLYEWGDGCRKSDGALLHYAFSRNDYDPETKTFRLSLLEDLHARGYDLTTLKFSIRKQETGEAEG